MVESQYQAPLVPDPTYTFQRQGTSSVDLLLPQQAASASETLYSRFLRTAYILNGARWQELKQLFAQGGNNEVALEPLIASSALQSKYRSAILSDFTETLDDVRRAAGYDGDTYATERYNRRAALDRRDSSAITKGTTIASSSLPMAWLLRRFTEG